MVKQIKQGGIFELLRSQGSVIVNKALIHEIGIDAALLLAELSQKEYYFQQRGTLDEEGMFFNTNANLELDTGLKSKRLLNACKELEELGLIYTRIKGMPSKKHYKIIATDEKIMKLVLQGKEKMAELQSKYQKEQEIDRKDVSKRMTIDYDILPEPQYGGIL